MMTQTTQNQILDYYFRNLSQEGKEQIARFLLFDTSGTTREKIIHMANEFWELFHL